MINEAEGLPLPLPSSPPASLKETSQTAPGRASLSDPDLGQEAALPAKSAE